MAIRPGISNSAIAISLRPHSARDMSATLYSSAASFRVAMLMDSLYQYGLGASRLPIHAANSRFRPHQEDRQANLVCIVGPITVRVVHRGDVYATWPELGVGDRRHSVTAVDQS